VSCRLDYCNSLLAGVADVHLCRLPSLQNATAPLISSARRHDHITLILATLHRLPVRQRVIFKTAVLLWKCLHDEAPCYLCADGVYGRPLPVSFCSLRRPPGALASDVYCLAQPLLCFATGPGTDYQRPFDHQNCRSLYSSVSTRPTCSSTRQCWLKLLVTCTILWHCCDCTDRRQLQMSRLASTRRRSVVRPVSKMWRRVVSLHNVTPRGTCPRCGVARVRGTSPRRSVARYISTTAWRRAVYRHDDVSFMFCKSTSV